MLTIAALTLAPLALAAGPQTIKTELIASGGMKEVGYYRPVRLTLSEQSPDTITRLPANLKAPIFGVLDIDAGDGHAYHVILDEPDGEPSRLFVDTNANGDFSDDPDTDWTWELKEQAEGPARSMARGSFQIDLTPRAEGGVVSMGAYRFDKNDPKREQLKMALLFYRDYALKSNVTFHGKDYELLVSDEAATGDFRDAEILIDINGNGKVDSRGERFKVGEPFNIGGDVYVINLPDRVGSALTLAESDAEVAEVLPPPNHAVGEKITAFKATTFDGKPLSFPQDYRGKIVMIDFWATWCGPCMKEVPGLVEVYQKYQDDGFDVLGISLDSAQSVGRMPGVMKDNKMTWTQICDEKGWKAELAQLYGVSSIPTTILVNATTGEILATNNALRGDKLDETVKNALDALPRSN